MAKYDHRRCNNCNKEADVFMKVKVHTGYVPDCENTVPEWTNKIWCLKCVATEVNAISQK